MMTTLPPVRVLVAVAAAVAIIACAAGAPIVSPGTGPIAVGTWGGDSGALIVGDTGLHLHIACTYGDMHGPVTPDSTGRFSVTGQYLFRAYPIAFGPMLPARFDGQRNGNTITIRVTVNDTTQRTTVVRGPVTVELGATPKMMNCPICRDPYGMLRRNQSVALLRHLR